MRKSESKHYTDSLASLIVFGLFAVSAVLTLLNGAGVYKRITQRDAATYDAALTTRYIRTKLDGAQSGNLVSVQEIDGTSVLCIEEEIAGKSYITYIYCFDGYLTEQFTLAGKTPRLSSGEQLTELKGAEFSIEDGFFTASVTCTSGEEREVMYSLSDKGKGETHEE